MADVTCTHEAYEVDSAGQPVKCGDCGGYVDAFDYLAALADWAAGQGFCHIVKGMKDPDEWASDQWGKLGPPNGDGYSPQALAVALRTQAEAATITQIVKWLRSDALHGESVVSEAWGQTFATALENGDWRNG